MRKKNIVFKQVKIKSPSFKVIPEKVQTIHVQNPKTGKMVGRRISKVRLPTTNYYRRLIKDVDVNRDGRIDRQNDLLKGQIVSRSPKYLGSKKPKEIIITRHIRKRKNGNVVIQKHRRKAKFR
jgi:hypothetical protein